MVSIADRPIFFVHQTQKKNIDKYQKNRVCFILTPNITVEYTQTPKTVKIPVSVNDFFKSELKGFRTISTTYRSPVSMINMMIPALQMSTAAV
jgi:hypothetical protein